VYQLQCADCPRRYVGQTGRTFKTRFKEHIRDIKNNGQNSKFAMSARERSDCETVSYELPVTSRTPAPSQLLRAQR
jgi:hypothetical protein